MTEWLFIISDNLRGVAKYSFPAVVEGNGPEIYI